MNFKNLGPVFKIMLYLQHQLLIYQFMGNKIEKVILFQIDQTSKASKIYTQREFDRLGIDITVEQWMVLKIIDEDPEISQKELADKSLRDPASITRTLDLLQLKGLIERTKIPGNRRQYNLILTHLGEEFIHTHLPGVEEHRKGITKGLSKKEIHKLSELLLKIQDNLG